MPHSSSRPRRYVCSVSTISLSTASRLVGSSADFLAPPWSGATSGHGVGERPEGSGDESSYACDVRNDADDERNALDEPEPYEGRRRVL